MKYLRHLFVSTAFTLGFLLVIAALGVPKVNAETLSQAATLSAQIRPDAFSGISHKRLLWLDQYARAVPQSYQRSFPILLSFLLKPAQDDYEKVRLIYVWMITHFRYNERSVIPSRTPVENLGLPLLIREGLPCRGFGELFAALAKSAGLSVQSVEGYASVGGAKPVPEVNHEWNAVRLHGQWRLLDTTWGAGAMDGGKYEASPDEYFYLAPLEAFALTHFDFEDRFGVQKKMGLSWSLFSSLSENTRNLVYAGFSVSSIIAFVHQAKGQAAVQTFDQPFGSYKVLDAPMQRHLNQARQKFVIESSIYQELMAVQGKSWVRFSKHNHTFSLNFEPQKGELLVMGRSKNASDYDALLRYIVR